MTDALTLGTLPVSEPPVAVSRPVATSVYDPAQLKTVIDKLAAALKAAKALNERVEEIPDATAREVIELRISAGLAAAAVMSFQPRRPEPF